MAIAEITKETAGVLWLGRSRRKVLKREVLWSEKEAGVLGI